MSTNLESCLGWSILWQCDPFINVQYSFYNLGTAITVIGILFTGYQLLNDEFKFRLRFRRAWANTFLYWFVLGGNFLAIIIWTLLPVLPWQALPVFWYRPFWELLGALSFIVGIIGLMTIATTPIRKIWEKDLEILEGLVVPYLAKWAKWANILCEEMKYFFASYFDLLALENPVAQRMALLFADEFLLYAISENPWTIYSIFDAYLSRVKEYEDGEIRIERLEIIKDWSFLKNVFNELLSNNESIISRELREKSFVRVNGWYGIFCCQILENPELITKYALLSWYDYSPFWKNRDTFNQNYLLFWGKALESLFSSKILAWGSDFTNAIKSGLSVISWIVSSQKDIETAAKCFNWIHNFRRLLQENLDRLLAYFPASKIPEPFLEAGEHVMHHYSDYKENNTFLDVIVFGFSNFLDTIAQKIETDETKDWWRTRHLCMELMEGWNIHKTTKHAIIDALDARMEIVFEERIERNLLWWYPMFLPLFFHAYGYQLFEEFRKDWFIQTVFYKKIMLRIKEKFPRISEWYVWWAQESTTSYSVKKSEQILKDILPKNMEYDKTSNTLIYYYSDRESSESIPLSDIQA